MHSTLALHLMSPCHLFLYTSTVQNKLLYGCAFSLYEHVNNGYGSASLIVVNAGVSHNDCNDVCQQVTLMLCVLAVPTWVHDSALSHDMHVNLCNFGSTHCCVTVSWCHICSANMDRMQCGKQYALFVTPCSFGQYRLACDIVYRHRRDDGQHTVSCDTVQITLSRVVGSMHCHAPPC